jgi:hypothetical protein
VGGTTPPRIWLGHKTSKAGVAIMPLISRLIGSVAFLSMAVCSANAALRDQTGSLHWLTFQVPEYGTRVDYPARIFAAVGGQRKALVSASKGMMVGPPSLFMHARTRRATHQPVISGRTYGSLASITNESLALSLRSPWNGRGRSTTADAIFRGLPAAPYIVSTWSTPRTRSGSGTLW